MFIKKLLKYLLLALIQGFTEPLPISSSAHMIIVSKLLDITKTDLTFEIFLNLASMLAILLFMFTKRLNIKKTINNKKLIFKVIIASIPCGILGFLFKNAIEKISLNCFFIGLTLIVTSVMLLISRAFFNKTTKDEITYKDSLFLGITESFALIPGISRMGSVMTCGLVCKLKIREVLDFSFLMYLVVSIGSFILSIPDLLLIDNSLIYIYIMSFITTFIVTYFSIKWFYNIINRKSLFYFSLYTLLLGLILMILGN